MEEWYVEEDEDPKEEANAADEEEEGEMGTKENEGKDEQ